MKAHEVIVRRLVKELQGRQGVALGPGLPELAGSFLSDSTQTYLISGGQMEPSNLNLAVVEAVEVSQQGDLCLLPGAQAPQVAAKNWVVATTLTDPKGNPKIVRRCRYPVFQSRCVKKIITEKGVIEVTDQGLVLREIKPGVGTDEVKSQTGASLHIADDIKLMEL